MGAADFYAACARKFSLLSRICYQAKSPSDCEVQAGGRDRENATTGKRVSLPGFSKRRQV